MKPTVVELDEILAEERIAGAWRRVRGNRGGPGSDLVTIDELAGSFAEAWTPIHHAVVAGRYHPQPLRVVPVPKSSGGVRELAIPGVLDRVLQQSMAAAISSRWESRFSAGSFAYRPGRGPADAICGILHAGKAVSDPWAAALDIRDCFDSIPHEALARVLEATPCSPAVRRLAMGVAQCPRIGDAGLVRPQAGLPQGSPLSPVLANAVLDPLDHQMTAGGVGWLRYADNLLVIADSRARAEAAIRQVESLLAALGMQLNPAKTRVARLAEIEFLGFSFQDAADGSLRPRVSTAALEACRRQLHLLQLTGTDAAGLDRFLTQWLGYYGLGRPDPRLDRFLTEVSQEFGIVGAAPAHQRQRQVGYGGNPKAPRADIPEPAFPGPAGLLLSFAGFLVRRVRIGIDVGRGGRTLPGLRGVRLRLGRHQVNLRF